jgi:hypothetical protein
MRAVHHVELQLDGSQSIPQLGVLAGERVLVHILGQTEVQEAILLLD